MAVDKLVDSTQLDADLTSVANAIRTKGGTSSQLAFPAGFVSAVQAIPTGGVTPTGTKNISITQNGTTTEDVTNYASAQITVNVPNPSTGTLQITAPGTYNVTNYASVEVDIDMWTEQTIATDGAVTQALSPYVMYHFTGTLTSLTVTLAAAAQGQIPHYHFDFASGSTAPTLNVPLTVTMPSGFSVEASKHYEIDILNNYGTAQGW